MPNENEQPVPAERQAAPATGQQEQNAALQQPAAPAFEYPHEALARERLAAKNKFFAEHEGAHALVYDDLGTRVLLVSIRPGAVLTRAENKEFHERVERTNWANPAEREAMKQPVLDYATMLVAGHLAENMIGSPENRVSTRLQEETWRLKVMPEKLDSDRDRVAYYLQLIHCNTLEQVLALEKRAEEIFARRQAHLKDLAKSLVDRLEVDGKDLETALGKAPGA